MHLFLLLAGWFLVLGGAFGLGAWTCRWYDYRHSRGWRI